MPYSHCPLSSPIATIKNGSLCSWCSMATIGMSRTKLKLFQASLPNNYHSLTSLIFPDGKGNGNPLQYSCLENPMDRGAWRAIQFMGSQRVGSDRACAFPESHHLYGCLKLPRANRLLMVGTCWKQLASILTL